MPRTRCTRTLLLPRGKQIEIEYNLRRPSTQTIVRQVEALGYTVLVRPAQYQHFWQDINTHGFTSQHIGVHILLIYPPLFDPQDSVEVEITEDLYDFGQRPDLE